MGTLLESDYLIKFKGGYFMTSGELLMNPGGKLHELVNRLKGDRKIKAILTTDPDITSRYECFVTYEALKALGKKESDPVHFNEFDYLAGCKLLELDKGEDDEFAADDWVIIDSYDKKEQSEIRKHLAKGILDYESLSCSLWEDAKHADVYYSENPLVPIFINTSRSGNGPFTLILIFEEDAVELEETEMDPEEFDTDLYTDDFFAVMDESDIEDYE